MAAPVLATVGIDDEHRNKFKVIYTLNSAGQLVLLTVYQCIKPFNFNKNIKEHLTQDRGWSETKFKKKFDKTQISTIENSPKTGERYDISLLITCFRALSEEYYPGSQSKWTDVNELEGRCKKLKDIRNDTFHATVGISLVDMKKQIYDIEKLLIEILESLKLRYPGETTAIDDMIRDIHDRIAHIHTTPLSQADVRTCCFQLNMQLLKDKIPIYRNKCRSWGKIGILDFLMGSEKIFEIQSLFTEVIVQKSNFRDRNTKVPYTDIFKSPTPAIILINAEAGGGKTTIFRFGIWDWSEQKFIMNTADYDLIFPMLFRNPHINSVGDLIKDLFPEASKEINIADIMDLLADPSLKTIFFCDGFDEKNQNSIQLFREICELKRKYPHIEIVCSSRPESVREFYLSVGKDHSIEHVKVLGVHESDKPIFLRRYHDEMVKKGLSKQKTCDLLTFFESQSARRKELYRLPIYLVILAHIWGVDPERAKTIRSAAGLYEAILDILNRKLVARIVDSHPEVLDSLGGDVDELICLINDFKDIIHEESLAAIISDRIYFNDVSVKKFRDFCRSKGLPFIQLKGAFLLTSLQWENINDLKEVLEVGHKGILDYFTAMCIVSRLSLNIRYMDANKIKSIILDFCDKFGQNVDIKKFQNICQLVGGILAMKDDNLLEEYGKDVIELLAETGIENTSQWIDTFNDLNVNPKAAAKFGKLIAPHLKLDNFTIKDSDIDILSVLLQFVDIQNLKVKLDISTSDTPKEFPTLMQMLSDNKCKVSITNVNDVTVELWNQVILTDNQIDFVGVKLDISSKPDLFYALIDALIKKKCKVTVTKLSDEQIDQDDLLELSKLLSKINIDEMELVKPYLNLSFLENLTIWRIKFNKSWRELQSVPPDMPECNVEELYTAARSTAALPSTLTHLFLGLVPDAATGVLQDPGLAEILNVCPELKYLGVHLAPGSSVEHLPKLSRMEGEGGTDLYLSHLEPHLLHWASDTAAHLQPTGGYANLILPSYGLQVDEVITLCELLQARGVEVEYSVVISSPHSEEDKTRLEGELRRTLDCGLWWYQDDTALGKVAGGDWW